MKKLITAAVASAFAFLAIGAVNAVDLPSGTSVESYTGALLTDKDDAGTGSDSTYWFLQGDDQAELLVTNYVGEAPSPRPEQFSGGNNNYLKIETNGRLYRSIGINDQTATFGNTVDIGDGIYLDTLVQFTAADDQFKADAITEGDKIAISYVERDADSVEDGETPYTNFVVRAAYVDAANSKIVATNYFLTFPGQPANEVQFDKDAWHRLTVRAISNVGNAYAPVGFVVYVDGTNLVYNASVSGGSVVAGDETYVESLNSVVKTYLYKEGNYALLPSLLRYGETGYNTLSAVAFNGNGCVDDISFTANKPGILPSEGMTVTIAWDDNVASYTVVAGETTLVDGEVVSGEGSTNLLLSAGITAITVTATYGEGYEAGALDVTAGTLNNGEWTFENGATLTINSMFPKFEVNGGHYGSFQNALGAAVTASTMTDPWTPVTIKMLSNIDEGVSFSTGNIVLDLNGKTLQGGSSSYYTIQNTGAELAIIDSVSGGKVLKPTKTGSEGSVYTESPLATTIWGGTFDEAIKTQKMDEGDGEDNLILHGGVFADSLYDPSSAESEENQFYLKSYIADSSATYNDGYFTVGSPIIGTYTVTVTPTDNATYAAVYNEGGAAVEFVNDVAAVTVGKTITITATPASGYEYADTPTGWTAGQDGKITIEVSAEATVAIPAPTAVVIGTYQVTVTPTANATYAAVYNEGGAAVEFVNDVAAVTVGKTITITATPAANYEYAEAPTGWTLSEGVITIEVSEAGTVAIPAPSEKMLGTYTVTVTPTNNTTYAAAYKVGGSEITPDNDVLTVTVGQTIVITATPAANYEYATTPTGWTAGQDGEITIEVSEAGTVAIPGPTEKGGKTYPSYIDDTEKTKYDTWAAYAEISAADFPDATGSNEEAYLLNCKPSEVADAKAAFKFTAFDQANPKDTTKTTTTTSYNGRDYNGTVVIKQYSDVGCTTESATGTFFRAVLQ